MKPDEIVKLLRNSIEPLKDKGRSGISRDSGSSIAG
jgi:hypothetical protein